jgi:hypothetical protein
MRIAATNENVAKEAKTAKYSHGVARGTGCQSTKTLSNMLRSPVSKIDRTMSIPHGTRSSAADNQIAFELAAKL